MKAILLIDGENFKYKLKAVFKENDVDEPLWYQYDYRGLLDKVLEGIEVEERVFYFAKLKKYKETERKSVRLIEEQRLLKTHLENQGFKVILSGRVRGQERKGLFSKEKMIFKEKGVDVKIAVDMVILACGKKIKEIVLASSDSDLQPAIKEVRDRGVKCIYVGFENQPNKGLTYTTNRTILIRNAEVFKFSKVKSMFNDRKS